jgi:TRAP-type C4-dicarboxylate transport system permease small subunit
VKPRTSLNAGAPGPLRLLLDVLERLARLDGWLGAACLVALTLLMLAEITVRALSNVLPFVPADIPVAWEYSSYLMAACFTFGAAMTLRAGGHIRVSLVLANLAAPARRSLEIAAALAATAFTGFLAVAMLRFTWTAFDHGQTSVSSGTPLWIPESVVTFGLILLALQFFARSIQAIAGLPLEDHRIKPGAPAE